jgi:hypothetical protein
MLASCGNGLLDGGEECDPAGDVSACTVDTPGDGTNACNPSTCQCECIAPNVVARDVTDCPVGQLCDLTLDLFRGGELVTSAAVTVSADSSIILPGTRTPPPSCGDGVLDAGEDCDPGDPTDGDPAPDDAACPQQCLPDCTCLTPELGDCGKSCFSSMGTCIPFPEAGLTYNPASGKLIVADLSPPFYVLCSQNPNTGSTTVDLPTDLATMQIECTQDGVYPIGLTNASMGLTNGQPLDTTCSLGGIVNCTAP